MLDFIVDMLLNKEEEDQRAVVDFIEELADLGEAARLPLTDLCSQVKPQAQHPQSTTTDQDWDTRMRAPVSMLVIPTTHNYPD